MHTWPYTRKCMSRHPTFKYTKTHIYKCVVTEHQLEFVVPLACMHIFEECHLGPYMETIYTHSFHLHH